MDASPHDLMAAATPLDEQGFAVLPIPAKGYRYARHDGSTAEATGKGPIVRGWQSRRLSLAEVKRQLQKYGDKAAGVGVVSGHLSGNLVILDFDGEGWQAAFQHVLHSWPELENTPCVRTGSGKRHLWLRCPDLPPDFTHQVFDLPWLNAQVELRGNRCQTLVPPSSHPCGGHYEWLTDPAEGELAEVPFQDLYRWLVEWAGQDHGHKRAEPLPAQVAEGQGRNNMLTSLCGTLRRRGLTESEMLDVAQVVNTSRCRPPLLDDEVARIAHSVARYPAGELVSPQLAYRGDGRRATESVLHTIDGPVCRTDCRKMNAADLRQQGTPDLDYLPFLGQDGYLVRGWATLIAGYPKAGKTELLARLCHEWQGERILCITEEPESIWAARLAMMPDGWEHVTLLFGLGVEPEELLSEIANCAATVVVIDSVRNLLGLHDETDNSEVARVLTPYIAACRAGHQTLLLIHHIRKGGGHYGEGITGGHAFLGIVDCALELLREQSLGDNRRKIRGWARVTPISELVYELAQDRTMTALGKPELLALEQVKDRALEALSGEWQKLKELREALEEPRPSTNHLRAALNALVAEGTAQRDPKEAKERATYRYRLPPESVLHTDVPIGVQNRLSETEQYYLTLAEEEP